MDYKIIPVGVDCAYLLSRVNSELFTVSLNSLSYRFMSDEQLKKVILERANYLKSAANRLLSDKCVYFSDHIDRDVIVKPRLKELPTKVIDSSGSDLSFIKKDMKIVLEESLDDTIKRAESIIIHEREESVLSMSFSADFFNYRVRPLFKYSSKNYYSFDGALKKLNSLYPVINGFKSSLNEDDYIDDDCFASDVSNIGAFLKSFNEIASRRAKDPNLYISKLNKVILSRFKELLDS